MSLSTPTTTQKIVSTILRPISWISSGPDDKDPTYENIRNYCIEKNTNFFGKRTPLEYLGVCGLIISGIIGFFGIKQDSQTSKWTGGIFGLISIIITAIGISCGVSLSDKTKETDEQKSGPKIKAEDDERFKDIKTLFSDAAKKDTDDNTKKSLSSLLHKVGKDEIVSLLEILVQDRKIKSDDRILGLNYLKKISGEKSASAIAGVFKKGKDDVLVLEEAKKIFLRPGIIAPGTKLIKYLCDEENMPEGRMFAAEILSNLPGTFDEQTVDNFIKCFVETKNARVKEKVAELLGVSKDSRAIKPLTNCLINKDEYYEIRIAAIKSLSNLWSASKDKEIIPILIDIIKDRTVYDEAYESARSLVKTYEKSLPPGIKPLVVSQKDLQEAAKNLLKKIYNPTQPPPRKPYGAA